jgi:hypothetical protein
LTPDARETRIEEIRFRNQIEGQDQKLVSSGRGRGQTHILAQATLLKTKFRTTILDAALGSDAPASAAIQLDRRLEPFVDDSPVEQLDGVTSSLREATLAGVTLRFDQPWEGPFCDYATVLKDGNLVL